MKLMNKNSWTVDVMGPGVVFSIDPIREKDDNDHNELL